ncbi:yemanuclein [Haematobia irritans]|uniref:yemanuclein n=1 Tax=Haematobia irritans TaxID=7368 RepID=UPI003F4F93C6
MSDPKRVTLTTISSTVSSSLMTAGSSRFGADFLAPAEKTLSAAPSSGKNGKSLRLKVELFQTDSNKYPEFDYAKLLHVEKKKLKKLKQKSNGFSDPFEENDDDVARIAKELERKYGNAYVSGRGKNKRDDIDIGLGYDESDSFIDNTEAYDEMVPDEVETIEGGFYINCGALEFKKLHTESMTTKTDEIIKMPDRPKKAVISSSSSEESSSSDDDEEDDDEDDDSEDDDDDDDSAEEASVETTKSKSSSSAATTPADKKVKISTNSGKKKASAAPTENGNSAKKRKIKSVKSTISTTGSSSNSPKPPTDDLASDSERERNAKKIEKTTTVKDMLKAQRDNFLKSQTSSEPKSSIAKPKGKSSAEEAESSEGSDDGDDESDNNSDSNESGPKPPKDKKSASSNEDNQGNEKLRTTDTKLPEMEPDVLACVTEFRDNLKSKNLTGKKILFDDQLSESFLKIDDSLLCIDKMDRSMVYAHLEYHLALPRYFFFRKARQLREKEEKLKSKRAFNKLHKAVTETMPAVIASYDAELRRYAELQAANVNSDQPLKMPKKKFPWNPNLRNLLYDVYQVRWTSYPVLGKKKDTLEDFIMTYMSKKVVEIWPKGWMRYEELQKEIEKRKAAAKKAKEKATKGPTISIGPNALSTSSSTTQNPPPETVQRSNANSDTDSVASSNTSSSLKRKNQEANTTKPKSKAAKLNGDQQKIKTIPIGLDLTSPSKKTDHSITNLMSATSMAAVSMATTTSSAFSSTVAAVSQPLKHSSNTHVIDLDNYTCTNDIMQQAAAANAAAMSFALANAASSLNSATVGGSSSRRESSGDSEIEIVGFYPASKNANKKQKTNSRSGTPNSNQFGAEKTYNNNNNNNRNSKKPTPTPSSAVTSGALNLFNEEYSKIMIGSIMGEHHQVPLLNAAQKSSPSTSSSSPMPSNMPHQ